MTLPMQFVEGLARAPGDWDLRAVFADWCEENAEADVAACLRWMVRHEKRPYHGSSDRATWFNADTIGQGLGDPESDIPAAIFTLLEGGTALANHKAYATVPQAEEAFYHAWHAAREKGWSPEGGRADGPDRTVPGAGG